MTGERIYGGLQIIGLDGKTPTKRIFHLTKRRTFIGRDKRCGIYLNRDDADEVHAKLEVVLSNQSKDKPVLLNDNELKRNEFLRDGDVFTVATRMFCFKEITGTVPPKNTSQPAQHSHEVILKHKTPTLAPQVPKLVPAVQDLPQSLDLFDLAPNNASTSSAERDNVTTQYDGNAPKRRRVSFGTVPSTHKVEIGESHHTTTTTSSTDNPPEKDKEPSILVKQIVPPTETPKPQYTEPQVPSEVKQPLKPQPSAIQQHQHSTNVQKSPDKQHHVEQREEQQEAEKQQDTETLEEKTHFTKQQRKKQQQAQPQDAEKAPTNPQSTEEQEEEEPPTTEKSVARKGRPRKHAVLPKVTIPISPLKHKLRRNSQPPQVAEHSRPSNKIDNDEDDEEEVEPEKDEQGDVDEDDEEEEYKETKEESENEEDEPEEEDCTAEIFSNVQFCTTMLENAEAQAIVAKLGVLTPVQLLNTIAHNQKSRSKKCKQLILLASKPGTTSKYVTALVAKIPCVHHDWVLECKRKKTLLSYKPYLLKAGKSLVSGKEVKQEDLWALNPPFDQERINLHNTAVRDPQEYELIKWALEESGAKATQRTDGDSLAFYLVMGEPSLSVLSDARHFQKPVVSLKWFVECILRGKIVDPADHEDFMFDQSKPTTPSSSKKSSTKGSTTRKREKSSRADIKRKARNIKSEKVGSRSTRAHRRTTKPVSDDSDDDDDESDEEEEETRKTSRSKRTKSESASDDSDEEVKEKTTKRTSRSRKAKSESASDDSEEDTRRTSRSRSSTKSESGEEEAKPTGRRRSIPRKAKSASDEKKSRKRSKPVEEEEEEDSREVRQKRTKKAPKATVRRKLDFKGDNEDKDDATPEQNSGEYRNHGAPIVAPDNGDESDTGAHSSMGIDDPRGERAEPGSIEASIVMNPSYPTDLEDRMPVDDETESRLRELPLKRSPIKTKPSPPLFHKLPTRDSISDDENVDESQDIDTSRTVPSHAAPSAPVTPKTSEFMNDDDDNSVNKSQDIDTSSRRVSFDPSSTRASPPPILRVPAPNKESISDEDDNSCNKSQDIDTKQFWKKQQRGLQRIADEDDPIVVSSSDDEAPSRKPSAPTDDIVASVELTDDVITTAKPVQTPVALDEPSDQHPIASSPDQSTTNQPPSDPSCNQSVSSPIINLQTQRPPRNTIAEDDEDEDINLDVYFEPSQQSQADRNKPNNNNTTTTIDKPLLPATDNTPAQLYAKLKQHLSNKQQTNNQQPTTNKQTNNRSVE